MKAIAGWIGNIIGIIIGVSLAGNLMLIIISHTSLIHIEQKVPVEKIVYVTVTNMVETVRAVTVTNNVSIFELVNKESMESAFKAGANIGARLIFDDPLKFKNSHEVMEASLEFFKTNNLKSK